MLKSYTERLLFFPMKGLITNPLKINIDYEDVYIKSKDDETNIFHGWFIQGNNKNTISKNKCILFFHGNAGNIGFRLNYIQQFYELGFSQLYFDYPGFGLSDGFSNEKSCIDCSEEFYKYLLHTKNFLHNNIIFYGESIGGSIASSLANVCNIKYLIIQSSFTDIKEIVKNIIGNYFFINNMIIGFETLENVKKRFKLNQFNKKMKTLIIHTFEDELIETKHAELLSEFSDKLYMCKGNHSNVIIDSDFIFHFLSFIKEE
jgi:esterase/lipase